MKKENLFRNRNFIIIAVLVVVIAVVLIVSLSYRNAPSIPEGAQMIDLTQATEAPVPQVTKAPAPLETDDTHPANETPIPTATPASTETPAPQATDAVPGQIGGPEASDDPQATEAPLFTAVFPDEPAAYVLVTLPALGQYGILPIPSEGEYTYPIQQQFTDGTVYTNVLHVTKDGFFMESSTCDNHDCVDEGFVSLENRTERILGNAVYCLPNQVVAELFTAEELHAMQQPAEDTTKETPETGNTQPDVAETQPEG